MRSRRAWRPRRGNPRPRPGRRRRPRGSALHGRDAGGRAEPRPTRAGSPLRGSLGAGADCLELGLEERLVDLALIDRDAFLDTNADDRLAIDPQLLGELLWRQVVRHTQTSSMVFWSIKKPDGALCAIGLAGRSLVDDGGQRARLP